MTILVIGSGARECMIIKKLKKDKPECQIVCIGTTNNPQINNLSKLYIVNELNIHNLEIILTIIGTPYFSIIGPEIALKNACSDYLENRNIPCIGPLQLYAQIETSKTFGREFIKSIGLKKHSPRNISILGYVIENITNIEKIQFIKSIFSNFNNIVLKKDGLCSGKGVIVQGIDFKEKMDVIEDIKYLKKGENIIIEEKLEGEEYSIFSLTDGNGNIQHFPPIQDYKRLNESDLGPNTGGMGCVIDKNNSLPFLTNKDIEISEDINSQIIKNLNLMGQDNNLKVGYRGILYGSFIKTKDGRIYIIEFNSRFGDPEGIIALELLKTNFYNICEEIALQNFKTKMDFHNNAMIGIYLVPKNYPNPTSEKYDIYINDTIDKNKLIMGNVEKKDNHLYSLSSRAIFYFESGDDLYSCYNKIYKNIINIVGNLKYRKDIGNKFLSSYDKVGVSIDKGNDAIKSIKKYIQSTYTSNVLGNFGDFGGEFKFNDSILVSSIDGVGTKSILSQKLKGEEGFVNLGKDIVNHSVNDILVQGAYPLFFMDYYGTDMLNINELTNFIKGVSEACIKNRHMVLLGGETAEMPLVYRNEKTDLVGCIVGYKDTRFFNGCKAIEKGDIIIGIASDGPHTNGFSLINSIIDKQNNIDKQNSIFENLLAPHKSYLNDITIFSEKYGYESILGMAHITGGGIKENIMRVIPKNLNIELNDTIIMPEWCQYIMEKGNISLDEMMRIFNCGIGYTLIISKETFEEINKTKNEFIKLGMII